MAQRAEERADEIAEVLIEEPLGPGLYGGRAAHQAPEVDGTTEVRARGRLAVGDLVRARVTGTDGADLRAEVIGNTGPGAAGTPPPSLSHPSMSRSQYVGQSRGG